MLQDEQGSWPCKDKSMCPAVQPLLYALFFLFYSLFHKSEQDQAADILDLCSAGQCTMNSCDTLSNSIKYKAYTADSMAPFVLFISYYSDYVTIISIIFTIILIIPDLKILIWVRIYCRKLDNLQPNPGDKCAYEPSTCLTQSSSRTKVSSPMASTAAAAPSG